MFLAILLLSVLVAIGRTAEIRYIGSITDSIYAPTSIDVSDDHLAVLEPFRSQLTIYSAEGVLAQRVDFVGKASGLARLSESEYLFCDRAGKNVISVNILAGTQSVFLRGDGVLSDPIDVIVSGEIIYILDAGAGEIVKVRSGNGIEARFSLVNSNGNRIGFASSFAFNRSSNLFYILDQLSSEIWKFSADGQFRGSFCSFGGSDGQVTRGGKIACDIRGNLYVSDRFQGTVSIFSGDGEFKLNIDFTDFGRSSLPVPSGLAVDDQGFVYIASTEGRRIELVYINLGASPNNMMTAFQAYPVDDDTIDVDSVRLVSYVEDGPGARMVSGFDFQLFTDDNLDQPLIESLDIPPSEQNIDSLDYPIAAQWIIESRLQNNSTYRWRVRAKNSDSAGDWSDMRKFHLQIIPKSFALNQNYPNPFNPTTFISFDLPRRADVMLAIFNTLGQVVRSFEMANLPAGNHEIIWDGTDSDGKPLSSGIYFYRLTSEDFVKTRKMVMIK